MSIAVIDYGMGNLRSVSTALEHVAGGRKVIVTADPAVVAAADRVVFPGQGAMPDCMAELEARGLRAALSVLSARFNKTAFINIVEEPEQNLFPSSQCDMLKSLLAFNNQGGHNRLVLTTHSPYIVNYLSLAIQGKHLQQRINEHGREELLHRLDVIVPLNALLEAGDVAIYQCDERDGRINRLPCFGGIPSDENLLNDWLHAGNDLFDQLLELEETV